MRCAHPGYDSSLFRHLHQTERSWALADDEHPGFFVFGAVPMHLLAEMRHEAAGRHGYPIVLVELGSACDPPRAIDDDDEAIVGVKVRLAEIIWLQALDEHVKYTRIRVVAQEHRI